MPTMHTIEEHEAQQVKPYIDAKIQNLSTVISKNGAKNLLPNNATTQVINGVTFTVNRDGTVTVSGTATGAATLYLTSSIDLSLFNGMLLNGCPVSSSTDAILRVEMNNSPWTGISQNVSDAKIDGFASGTLGKLFIRVFDGKTVNATFKPMIRLASDTDPTYEPYAKTNQQLTQETTGLIDNTKANGCVNLLETDITSRTTAEGVVITANSDGSYTVSSSSAPTVGKTIESSPITLEPGTYYWCCAKDGESPMGEANCFCFLVGINGTNDWKRSYIISESSQSNYGEFTVTQTSSIKFCIRHGTATISSRTFYPMIRRIGLKTSYVPYAKTNKELTEDVTALESQINADTGRIKNLLQVTNATLNIYCTNDTAPDWSNLTAAQATDIAQGIYDYFKKIGGEASIYYIGLCSMRYLKASDGTQLGSSNNMIHLFSNTITYNTMLADNTKARLAITMRPYGNSTERRIGLWGKYMTLSVHGVASNGDVTNIDTGITHNTISTYKG